MSIKKTYITPSIGIYTAYTQASILTGSNSTMRFYKDEETYSDDAQYSKQRNSIGGNAIWGINE